MRKSAVMAILSLLMLAAMGLPLIVWSSGALSSTTTTGPSIVSTTQLSVHFMAGWTLLWPIVGPVAQGDIAGCSFSSVWTFDQGSWATATTINPSRLYAVLAVNDCTAVISSVVTVPFTDLPLDQGWHLTSSLRSWNQIRGDCALIPGTSSGPLSLFYDAVNNAWHLQTIAQDIPMDGLKAYFVQLLGPCQLRAAGASAAGQIPLSGSQLDQTPPPTPPCPPFCVSPPEPPSRLVASAQSSSQILITWQDNSNHEAGFKLERRASGGQFSTRRSVGANAVAFTDDGLTPSTTYCYRVNAFSALAESAFSDEACATTLPGAAAPAPSPPPPAPTPPPDAIVAVIDRNHNNLIDDDEILYAVSLWVNGTPVPGLASQPTIDDEEIHRIVRLWILQAPITGSSTRS